MIPTAPGRRSILLPLLLGLLAVGGGCRSAEPAADATPTEQYRAAIDDARTAAPAEIVTTLTPLVPHNDDLVWRRPAAESRRLLVVTWGGSDTLPSAEVGDTLTVKEDVWVTAVPVIRAFCRSLDRSGDALRLRLAQRLGLPPDADYDRFVELWVRPSELVRPCPDPEVSDRECELAAPVPSAHVRVSEAHQEWFRTLRDTSYDPDGYPFTGLGYTYDWHPATDEVGPSEFVLRPGAVARLHARQSTAAYCRAE